MKVELISYSQGDRFKTKEGGCLSLSDMVVFSARVSNPSNQMNFETTDRLISYLVRNQHWSPLEMVSICLEIETTRDIARQILRHRSFSFQEFSQRYAIADLSFEMREARLQDKKNRQSSFLVDDDDLQREWQEQQEIVMQAAGFAYDWAIENGIAKEQARVVLPEGNTRSRLYMNGTLRSWVHYIQLRTQEGTQKEHRDVAFACAAAIQPIFPMIDSFLPCSDIDSVGMESSFSVGSCSSLSSSSYLPKKETNNSSKEIENTLNP
jgi:thymidylate synthase (FAD)